MITYNLKIFFVAFIVFLITDMVWLGAIAKGMYFAQYREWLRLHDGQLQLVWWSALIVYFLFALSVVVFIAPLADGSVYSAGIYGALLGVVIYGIYNFTCLAIFKNWPVGMAFIDCAWGTFLCAWSSAITIWIQNHIK